MAVDEDDPVEAVVDQAPRDVVHHRQQRGAPDRDGAASLARLVHVLRRVAHPYRRAVQYGDHVGDAFRHVERRDGVGVERQVRTVLLEAGHGHQNEVFVRQVFLDVRHRQVAEVPGEELGAKRLVAFGEAGQMAVVLAVACNHGACSSIIWINRSATSRPKAGSLTWRS